MARNRLGKKLDKEVLSLQKATPGYQDPWHCELLDAVNRPVLLNDETTHIRVPEMIALYKDDFNLTFDDTFDFNKDKRFMITGVLATKKYSEIKRLSMKVTSILKRSGHNSIGWEKVDEVIAFLSNYSDKADATRMFVIYAYVQEFDIELKEILTRLMPEKFRREAGLRADPEIEVERAPKRSKPTDRGAGSKSPLVDADTFQPLVDAMKESKSSVDANIQFSSLCEMQVKMIQVQMMSEIEAAVHEATLAAERLMTKASTCALSRATLKSKLEYINSLNAKRDVGPMDIDSILPAVI